MLFFQPALLLVDFGHFQYNSVMLGQHICILCPDVPFSICYLQGFRYWPSTSSQPDAIFSEPFSSSSVLALSRCHFITHLLSAPTYWENASMLVLSAGKRKVSDSGLTTASFCMQSPFVHPSGPCHVRHICTSLSALSSPTRTSLHYP
jgi:hypothetical protein